MLKSVLVGKDAVVVGLSNAVFQEVTYKAKIHPKRRAADLDEGERWALYDAIREVLDERLQLEGKEDFVDLYGNSGKYQPIMASHMLGQPCLECGTTVDKLSMGGGATYFCPSCQR
jgi:formamidopyrimidine-DNA glycosylase